MTVRLEKSTRLPDKLPRKRPCFPFNLCTNPLLDFLGWNITKIEADSTKIRSCQNFNYKTSWLKQIGLRTFKLFNYLNILVNNLHIYGDAWSFTVDVESTVKLKELPVFIDHLSFSTWRSMFGDHIIDEHNLWQLHGQIIFISMVNL